MIPVKIADIKTNIPTSWDEITLGQYIDLVNYKDDLGVIRLLSIVSGVSYNVLLNIDSDKFDERILDTMEFIKEPINIHDFKDSDEIKINGKVIKVPNPSTQTIGQKLLMQSKVRIAQGNNTMHAELVCDAVAIYLQPLIDGTEFDDSRIEEIKRIVYSLPLVDVYPVGSFFLRGWLTFLRLSGQPLQTIQQTKKLGRDVPLFSLNFMSSILLSSYLTTI